VCPLDRESSPLTGFPEFDRELLGNYPTYFVLPDPEEGSMIGVSRTKLAFALALVLAATAPAACGGDDDDDGGGSGAGGGGGGGKTIALLLPRARRPATRRTTGPRSRRR
jgi:hypothetical protein